MSIRRAYLVTVYFLAIIFCTCSVVVILMAQVQRQDDYGVELVRAMYDFESPAELIANQQVVKSMLTEDEWERLQLDNTLRTVSAYFKFNYNYSRVTVVDSAPGYVMYKIYNESIPRATRWLLFYRRDADSGKLSNIREYKVIADGGSVLVDEF